MIESSDLGIDLDRDDSTFDLSGIDLEYPLDALTPNEFASLYCQLQEGFYAHNNLILHESISPDAITFIPPDGVSYIVMNMTEDCDVDVKAMFSLSSEDLDLYQMGEFEVTTIHNKNPVHKIDIRTIGDIITVPTCMGYFVSSLVYREDGIYSKPKTKSHWD